MTVPTHGFISYAHDDYAQFQEFRAHLRATELQFGIAFWADPSIAAGYHWSDEIASHIATKHSGGPGARDARRPATAVNKRIWNRRTR